MRQFRGLRGLRIAPQRDRAVDDAIYQWVEPTLPSVEDILASSLTGSTHINRQIQALRESYPIVEKQCREAVFQRHMTAADAAQMLTELLVVRNTLERMAVTDSTVKRRKKAAA